MASVGAQVEIAATPREVWEVLADPGRFGGWVDNHVDFVGEPPQTYRPGQSFGQRIQVMGLPVEVRWRVEELVPPLRIGLSGNGPMGIALGASYDVTPVSTGSRVAMRFDFSGPAAAMMVGQIEAEVGPSLRRSLDRLRVAVESSAGSGPPAG